MIGFSYFPADGPRLALGCMRLSTERERDEVRSVTVLHAAFDAGITLLDTADAYCRDATDIGHNERLIARASRPGPAIALAFESRPRVASHGPTGGGRPTDGRDTSSPLARRAGARSASSASTCTSFTPRSANAVRHQRPRARVAQTDGYVESIGLCNVNVGQIEEARDITEIAAVQIELSVWKDDNMLNGVAGYCIANDIPLLAYRPIGGAQRRHRTQSDAFLADLAASKGATPFEIAIAWLLDLSALVVPVAGATRVETVHSLVRATGSRWTADGPRAS